MVSQTELLDTPIPQDVPHTLDAPQGSDGGKVRKENNVVFNRKNLEASVLGSLSDGDEQILPRIHEGESAREKGASGQDHVMSETQKAVAGLLESNQRLAIQLGETSPDQVEGIANDLIETNEQIQMDAVRQDAAMHILSKQLADPRVIDEDTRAGLAARAALARQAHDLVADMTVWDWVKDMGLELFPGKMISDTIQMTDSYNPFDWGSKVEELIQQYQVMTPEEQLDRVPFLIEDLLETNPPFKVAQIVQAIVAPSTTSEASFWLGTMSAIDALAAAAGIVKIASRAAGSQSLVRLASTLGDKKTAARVSNSVLLDETENTAVKLDIEKTTAVDNASPLNPERYNPAADVDMAPEAAEGLVKFQEATRGTIAGLREQVGFIGEASIAESDIPEAARRIDGLFFDHVLEALGKGDQILDVKSIEPSVGNRSVTYSFKVRRADGTTVDDTFERPFLRNDNGEWESLPEPTILSKILLSPKARAAGGFERVGRGASAETDFLEAAESAGRLDFADSVVQKVFSDLLLEAVKPISKLRFNMVQRRRDIEALGEVLTYGDEIKRVFTPGELRMGVSGHKFNKAQQAAYYQIREVMDSIADNVNLTEYNRLQGLGAKTVFSQGEALGFGVPIQSIKEIPDYLNRTGITRVLEAGSGKSIHVGDQDWEALYGAGHRLVRMEGDVLKGGHLHQHVLIHGKGLRQLPPQVIHLHVGYVPRLNPKAVHFVQVITPSTRDGIVFNQRKAVRGFDSQQEANKFRDELNAKIAAGDIEEGSGFTTKSRAGVNKDTEIEQFSTGSSGLGASQGLIYGPRRTEGALPFGPEELNMETPRVKAFEAIGLYLENSKNYVTRNEWRMSMRTKWENTARKMTGVKSVTWDDPLKALENTQLREARDQLNEWFGFSSPSEKFFDDMIQRIYEVVLDVGKRKPGATAIAETIHKMKHVDGANIIKTGTFHALLGAFNPAQLIVQGSGAAVAFSQGIIKSPVTFFKQNGLFLAQFFGKDGATGKHASTYAGVAKAFGWKPQTLRKYDDLWRKTGLEDSTFVSSDIRAAQAGFGVTAAAYRKLMNASTVFFRHGELFNRRVSFMQAIDDLGGIDKVLASTQLQRKMMTKIGDMTLNLGKFNRAAWQKGAPGITFQFAQIMTKTVETYLGLNGGFTKLERVKLFAMQAALYGSTALVGGDWLARQYMAQTGWTVADLNKAENKGKLALANGGLMDYLLQVYIGVDGTMAERTSLLNGLDQMFTDFFEEETTLWKIAFGPTSGVWGRVTKKIDLMRPWFPPDYGPGEMMADLDWRTINNAMHFAAEDIGGVIGAPFSSMSQITRYRMMANLNKLMDVEGRTQASPRAGFEDQTELAALLGVKPLVLADKFTLQQINANAQREIDDHVALRMNTYTRYIQALSTAAKEGRDVDPALIARYTEMNRILDASINNPTKGRKIREAFNRRRKDFEGVFTDQLSRQRKEYEQHYLDDLTDTIQSVNQRLIDASDR